MKKLFLFLLVGMFMISCVSAVTWDNVAYWKLDESSGAVIDSVGSYSGTNNGATAGATGKISTAYDFENTESDHISTLFNTSLTTFTVSTWFKAESDHSGFIIGKDTNTGNRGWALGTNTDTDLLPYFEANGLVGVKGTTILSPGTWYHLAVTSENGKQRLYLNGVNEVNNTLTINSNADSISIGRRNYPAAESYFDGIIDEVGIWNRVLDTSEILELYNSGVGFTYGGVSPGSVTLDFPSNGTTISDVGTNFTVSGSNLSTVSGTWNNVTYYVWSNETLQNETTISVSGETFNKTLFIDNFIRTDYEWNIEACYINVTGDYCVSSENNNTFTVSLYTLVDENYANETISGTLETFNISIDLFPGIDLTGATFYYNGTTQTPSIIAEDDNRFILVSDYQIPIISSDVNISFYWELEFDDAEMENTTERTQLVRAMFLDDCSLYTNRMFNISLFDEQTKTSLNGGIELIYNVLNANYETIKTYNFLAEDVNNTYVCSLFDLSEENLYYSAEIRYYSDDYASELYNIQRAEISEDTQQIDLYDLNSSSSTQFKITYQDSNFNFVEGAIIQLQRKYISEGIYEVVEAPLTSSEGIALVSVDLNSIKYRATVVKNGVVLDEFDNLVFKCQSELTGECDYKLLGQINPQNEVDLSNILDFYYSGPTISNNTITISFSIPSGTPSVINLVLEQKDEFGNETLCNRTITSSAGSISCTYSESLGDSYIDLYLSSSGVPMVRKTYILNAEKNLDWLGNNYVFILVLLLSLVGMALSSPEWIIINGIITMVISGALFLASGLDFVTGLGTIMWLVIAAIIIISKMSKQEDR